MEKKYTKWKVSGTRFIKDGSEQPLTVTVIANSDPLARVRATAFLHKIEKVTRA